MAKKQSVKPQPMSFDPNEFATDATQIDPALKQELEEQGLAYRWIDAKTYRSNGFHKNHYKPYKRKSESPTSEVEKIWGTQSDGFVMRGSMLLAAKPKAQKERHLEHIKYRTELQGGMQKKAAAELREQLAQSGIKADVRSGFEDDEE